MGYGLALDVTFRYVETPNDDFVRVFVPGSMNDWGPNSDGVISPDAESQMVFNEETGCYERTYDLSLGEEYIYKIHFHYNKNQFHHATYQNLQLESCKRELSPKD